MVNKIYFDFNISLVIVVVYFIDNLCFIKIFVVTAVIISIIATVVVTASKVFYTNFVKYLYSSLSFEYS